jgi:hypothetical protein
VNPAGPNLPLHPSPKRSAEQFGPELTAEGLTSKPLPIKDYEKQIINNQFLIINGRTKS